jgi:hypothetical protein
LKGISLALRVVLWSVFLLWLLMLVKAWRRFERAGSPPIDYYSYRKAADAIEAGKSPYASINEVRHGWLSFHRYSSAVQAAMAHGDKAAVRRASTHRVYTPGPYVYAPTLALLLLRGHISSMGFVALELLAITAFAWLWLRVTRGHPIWLLLVIVSDVMASCLSGNVELMLLACALWIGRLLWRRPGGLAAALVAAPMAAFVLLAKPFYVFFFIACGALQLAQLMSAARSSESAISESAVEDLRSALKTFGLTAAATIILIGLEVWSWGPTLREEAMFYFRHALEYQSFAIPAAEQFPFGAWNRTPLQVFIVAGFSPAVAQTISLVLWLTLLIIALCVAWGRRLGFPLTFAVSFVLLQIGRPLCWSFPFLDLVVITALWPILKRWQKVALIGLDLVWLGSHYWALITSLRGQSMQFVTLQSADFPWETCLLLPICGFLVFWAATRAPRVLAAAPA